MKFSNFQLSTITFYLYLSLSLSLSPSLFPSLISYNTITFVMFYSIDDICVCMYLVSVIVLVNVGVFVSLAISEGFIQMSICLINCFISHLALASSCPCVFIIQSFIIYHLSLITYLLSYSYHIHWHCPFLSLDFFLLKISNSLLQKAY